MDVSSSRRARDKESARGKDDDDDDDDEDDDRDFDSEMDTESEESEDEEDIDEELALPSLLMQHVDAKSKKELLAFKRSHNEVLFLWSIGFLTWRNSTTLPMWIEGMGRRNFTQAGFTQ
jgi:hypothetical protein